MSRGEAIASPRSRETCYSWEERSSAMDTAVQAALFQVAAAAAPAGDGGKFARSRIGDIACHGPELGDAPDEAGRQRNGSAAALTRHSGLRAGQRNFSRADVDYVLCHGRLVRRTGIRFYFLGEKDVPAED